MEAGGARDGGGGGGGGGPTARGVRTEVNRILCWGTGRDPSPEEDELGAAPPVRGGGGGPGPEEAVVSGLGAPGSPLKVDEPGEQWGRAARLGREPGRTGGGRRAWVAG